MNIQIPYTYEVVLVDEAARCMEIVYTSDGRQAMHIGARLPFQGESVEDVVKLYAPLAYWDEQERAVIQVQTGLTGSVAPTPASSIPTVPATVSRFQAKAALLQAGLLDSVEAMMVSESTPALARIAWREAQEFRRTSPTVLAMAQALNLTDPQMDALFVSAAAIVA